MNKTFPNIPQLKRIVSSILVGMAWLSLAQADDEIDRLFTLKVLPVLSEKCFGCHGDDPEEIEGGLVMHTLEDILFGGDGFDNVLVPGDAAESFMITAVKWKDPDYEMPPKENDRLTPAQIADLETWINAGAPWASEERQAEIRLAEQHVDENEDGILWTTSGGLGDEWTYRRYKKDEMWSFHPVEKPALVKTDSPIDGFIEEKLDAAGFKPAKKADALTRIRRATWDLTGLPPTPEEVTAFIRADKKNPEMAWGELVDRLLESPRYGERWGQHWLDVARYSDTGGMANDYEKSNAWRYRDYVIRAFNEDKPYDQFVMEQLAGDEMANESVRKRMAEEDAMAKIHKGGDYTEQETEWMIATGFLRMGAFDTAMVPLPEARQIYLDDIVNSVGQTFLSTTMRCFKCHDHKFDPLPTKDYYRMYATFAGTQLAERPARYLPEESMAGMDEGKGFVDLMHSFASERMNALKEKQEAAAKIWFEERGLEYINADDRKSLDDDVKPPRNIGLDYVDEGKLKVRQQDDWIWNRRKERFEPMVQSVYNGASFKGMNAKKLRIKEDEPDTKLESFILTGGALTAQGQQVAPGVLSALGIPANEDGEDPYVVTEDLEGRRLAFAQWVANPKNQLTTRSIVNRLWQHHFGKPVAGNPNNFGAKGGKPTHPKILDYLATELVEGGWKLKPIHRKIMLSDAYQKSGSHPQLEKLREIDPDNNLLAIYEPRRLTAEELRDGMLAITGELNTEMGGLPIMPEINMEVALQPRMIQFSLAPAHQPSKTPEERNRRSIYAYRVRGQADPFLELFNQPNPNDSCEVRDSVSVSPQAFTLMNSDVVTDRSIAFALRLEKETSRLKSQVVRAFEIALGRKPFRKEIDRMTDYLEDMRVYHQQFEPKPVEYPTEITRSLVEEFSGKPFEYTEILPAFKDYIPDAKANDVSPETRALADLCLVLFNSHEFVYVY
ncbi:MAG: PSD1 and planctomycete cytochrome C domain-containing protein [Verrucomicrobia bacterium]|nr:PSD1 and planctomycete cytochrome C domain-containing protein [Verrucomicrobiota bacterium]MDA1068361.1 PSD1 and planctomycete cytochrome C domain-containing protein [Verrucomicrobiota bacterium]